MGARDPVALAVFEEPRRSSKILLVRSPRSNAKLLGENPGRAAMIDMAVGQQDFLDRHAGLVRRRLEIGQVAAGIDERAEHRLRAPDQAAILLQRGDGNDRGAKRAARLLLPAPRRPGQRSWLALQGSRDGFGTPKDAQDVAACQLARF